MTQHQLSDHDHRSSISSHQDHHLDQTFDKQETHLHIWVFLLASKALVSSVSSLSRNHDNILRMLHQIRQERRPSRELGDVEGACAMIVLKILQIAKFLQPLDSVRVTALHAKMHKGLEGPLREEVSQVGPQDIVQHGSAMRLII